MFVEFNELPGNARIWIYQSKRELAEKEAEGVKLKLREFADNWLRHGEQIKGSFHILYNQFIVLGVDENFNNVSGCSIDSSVRAIKELEDEFDLDLMNKLNIAFKVGMNVNTVSLAEFQEYLKLEKVNQDTIVFNNMIQSKDELASNWEVPVKQSWHKQLLATI